VNLLSDFLLPTSVYPYGVVGLLCSFFVSDGTLRHVLRYLSLGNGTGII